MADLDGHSETIYEVSAVLAFISILLASILRIFDFYAVSAVLILLGVTGMFLMVVSYVSAKLREKTQNCPPS